MEEKHRPAIGTNALVLISGGLDSYACAHLLKQQGAKVRGVFIDYGQAAVENERLAVEILAQQLQIPVAYLYTHTSQKFGEGELLGRNAFLISAAVFLGGAQDGLVAIGVHAGTPYIDCSTQFFEAARNLVEIQSDNRLSLTAPFLDWSKAQIYQYLTSQELPVDQTYSCESGTIPPCGSCASCRDREALGC